MIWRKRPLKPIFMMISILAIVGSVHAHQNHNHKKEHEEKPASDSDTVVLERVNASYVQAIKPIFQKSCFDCHSSTTRFPWYSNIPGVKQLIESDIKESRKHLDLSTDFPFGGHGSPKEDLAAIREVIEDGSMPPLRYRALHPNSRLSQEEVRSIVEWIESSEKWIR